MRRVLLMTLWAFLLLFASVPLAAAESSPPKGPCLEENQLGGCIRRTVDVADGGASGASASSIRNTSGGSASGISSRPRVCEFEGRVIACSSEGGTWSDYVTAWCRPEVPQPSLEDPIWDGNTDGSIFVCVRPGFSGIPDPSQQFRRHLSSTQQAVDPVALAWQAVASMNLSAPELGMFPKPLGQDNTAMGYVGWPMWLWVADPSPQTWGPITASASDEGFTVTATARVDRIEWDMGNGEVITCGQGSKHPSTAVRGEQSPDCGYTYEVENIYTITATAYWDVTWSAPSGSGTLQLDLARSEEMLIGEIQVVNVYPGQR